MIFTPEQKLYLDSHMKKVSRSFALVVSYLEDSLREQLSTAYLLCRVVDNIEDCAAPYGWQQHRFTEFLELLEDPQDAAEILAVWDKFDWPGLSTYERNLMGVSGGQMLWTIYGKLPEVPRNIIWRWAADMASGMYNIKNPDKPPLVVKRDGVEILNTVDDYDRYCYYVAGTVGHMATELAVAFYGFSNEVALVLNATCEACGRALQKTNIIKDFAKDVARGVSYVPNEWLQSASYLPLSLKGADSTWKQCVLDNVFQELREATRYVLALPGEATGYRIASLLCLFPAYQTLLQGAKRQARLFTNRHQIKISRRTMINCIKDARRLVHDDAGILAYCQSSEAQFEAIFNLT